MAARACVTRVACFHIRLKFYICMDKPFKMNAQWAKVKVDVYVLLIPESKNKKNENIQKGQKVSR